VLQASHDLDPGLDMTGAQFSRLVGHTAFKTPNMCPSFNAVRLLAPGATFSAPPLGRSHRWTETHGAPHPA
jgi:hypothetical protein